MRLSEPALVAVAIGAVAFGLAALNILAAEARRTLELHFLRVKSVTLRNNYAREVLALGSRQTHTRAPTIPAAPPAVPPAPAKAA